MIDSGKKPAIKPHLIEEPSLGGWMSERVDLPADGRRHIEFSQ
jgi:hypothetical protein